MAICLDKDQDHELATREYQGYLKNRVTFYTNYLVISEFYTRTLYDHGGAALQTAIALVKKLVEGARLTVLDLNEELIIETETVMLKFAEHGLSFTDSSIYVSVKKYDLDEVFTIDGGLAKVGLRTSEIPE